MSDKTMVKIELIYLLDERNASVEMVNKGIKEINECDNYDDMVKVYHKYDELTK